MNSMVRSRAGRKTCTCATEVLTMPSPIRTNLFRLAELQKLAILDPAPERIYDDLVRSLFQNLEAPVAMMNLLDSHRDWFKSCVGLPLTESPASTSFCDVFLDNPGVLVVVDDTQNDARFADHPLVVGAPFVRFYAGARLAVASQTIGTLCVYDLKQHQTSAAQRDDLRLMASAAIELLTRHSVARFEARL